MSRSPLAYPLNRGADTDIGGAADLQTDVMRFMAILALCLVAIFALVQSIPLTPVEPIERPAEIQPVAAPVEQPTPKAEPPVTLQSEPAPESVALTRPEWVPQYTPSPAVEQEAPAVPPEPVSAAPQPELDGFTLRFASDAALTRAVAAHHVGLYALEPGRARRMTVSESRISFWDASTPNTYHEMEAGTVPAAVVDALARTGAATGTVSWAVTLPGKMKSRLDTLLQERRGGALIIDANGEINWETP